MLTAFFHRYLSKFSNGAIAQLVERLLCKQDVVGSNPSGSTNNSLALTFETQILISDLRSRPQISNPLLGPLAQLVRASC